MSFSAFLDKLQKMFNIFEEEGKAMTEQAKVRMLLAKIETLSCGMRLALSECGLRLKVLDSQDVLTISQHKFPRYRTTR